ncbi:L-seryl-tRNA(Sec) selenium transferase [Rhizocola hellebori]|uniref:L-seryl-tRNA(Sec) selenium transferase n=1 Tax=Rhizocola hellebori TaxID=1392758 RepID=A0A8J3QIS0_9ACTN|nr:L-seryl-tRNA(Sec) selenium transferase [Rhizocola hellebori]GIH10519.1 L-seryl-tRNA(Sec) selenium transferase [Rhizocola hellebori]
MTTKALSPSDGDDARRRIPATDTLLALPELASATGRVGRQRVKQAIVAAQQRARRGEILPGEVAAAAIAGLTRHATSLRHVINATGVIVHTNLGRAPLSAAATEALAVAAGATDVEFDLSTGERARRGRAAMQALAAAVPAAQAVHVVNNNAAALLLCGLALAREGEIIISRGELVEIGDGFRIPDLLASTGAQLREVGTTNRCSIRDYRDAIGPRTAFILKVHPSNFIISGFTSSVEVPELAKLGPPVVVDIGSGLLAPHPLLPGEPDASTVLTQGASLVTASGDKLLGGPQAGLLLGRSDLIELLRRYPAARALRVDKLTLAALEATLTGPPNPVGEALIATFESVLARVDSVTKRLSSKGIDAVTAPTAAAVGGGAAPGVQIHSAAVSLPAFLAGRLRAGDPPVVGRVENGRCLLDLRTVEPHEDDAVLAAVLRAGAAADPSGSTG